MKTNKEILEKLSSEMYRLFKDYGITHEAAYVLEQTATLELSHQLEQKDQEWRERMIGVLEAMPVEVINRYTKDDNQCWIHKQSFVAWQEEQINKLKEEN